ncbi:isoamylase [Massilia glaciei]|uniref:Glycogen-debranching protein n=1 Tax=Massilia glaciei TaxID=1524097 RepID=A0A2U2HMQ2_9BURK|nr:isoamylase [Massilia glaciei]PWF48695.1 glycogen-debranching protein [Massilia glaciei]
MQLHRLMIVALIAFALLGSPASKAAINASGLGADYDATKTNVTFKIYSSRASRIELFLYSSASGTQEKARRVMTLGTGGVWSLTIPVATLGGYGVTGTVYYGYRAWGPNWPYNAGWTKGSALGFASDVDAAGNRFNPNKLLVDPYARELSHDPLTPTMSNGTVYASGALYRNQDTGSVAPKAIVIAPDTVLTGTKPTRALKDDIIYEVHVRGLTMNDTSIAAAYRGTYKGAGLKAAYLAGLGVTAVEFLPLQETQNDTNELVPTDTAGDNYWGYMTLGFFAPDRRYAYDKAPGGPTKEFKAMVKAFHDKGIKVLIDVVYNHTGEGGVWNPADKTTYNIYGMRGLDNPTYYSLTADRQSSWDNTGVGGNYNTRNLVAQNLIVDSLAYWRNTLGVDGYRYDLASVLGNSCEHGCFNYDKLDPNTALNRIVRELPPRPAAGGTGADHVAEPWAIGGNSYQVGNFPAGWAEWNGSYRDTMRPLQNRLGSVAVTPGQLASRVAGSSDLYGDDGRRPWHSVNFITAHDGFTLKDLYSCNGKNNNQPWPMGPSDGGEDHNVSWDQGGIAADQRKAARNGMALMMLSGGVPMIVGGDEALRGINCNNNPYNLDSSANWLDWTWSAAESNFQAFAKGMMTFRKAHPALRPLNFYSGSDNNGNVMEQLRWFKPDGGVADGAYMGNANNHALAWRIDGSEFGDTASAIYVAHNAWSAQVNFTLPWPGTGKSWYRVTDTCNWAEGATQVRAPGLEDAVGGESTVYGVCGRGTLLLIAK